MVVCCTTDQFDYIKPNHAREPNQGSWWRRVYDRLSHTGADETTDNSTGTTNLDKPWSSTPNRRESSIPLIPEEYDEDPPPPSMFRTHGYYVDHSTPPNSLQGAYGQRSSSSPRCHVRCPDNLTEPRFPPSDTTVYGPEHNQLVSSEQKSLIGESRLTTYMTFF
jgi:hypothetical protein